MNTAAAAGAAEAVANRSYPGQFDTVDAETRRVMQSRVNPGVRGQYETENIKFIVPDKSKLAGTVVDNTEAKLVGEWKHSVHTPPFVGVSYIHDMKERKGQKSATFTPDLPLTGLYEVRVSHNSNIRRANGVPVTVHHSKGKTVVKVNEGEPAPIAKLFRSIGLFHFKKGREGSVTISTEGTEGKYVIVDSVQFLIVMP